ncbi:hypothetical protein J6590_079537, partial [Homalodisca vitripennis]
HRANFLRISRKLSCAVFDLNFTKATLKIKQTRAVDNVSDENCLQGGGLKTFKKGMDVERISMLYSSNSDVTRSVEHQAADYTITLAKGLVAYTDVSKHQACRLHNHSSQGLVAYTRTRYNYSQHDNASYLSHRMLAITRPADYTITLTKGSVAYTRTRYNYSQHDNASYLSHRMLAITRPADYTITLTKGSVAYTDVSNHQACRLHNHSNQGLVGTRYNFQHDNPLSISQDVTTSADYTSLYKGLVAMLANTRPADYTITLTKGSVAMLAITRPVDYTITLTKGSVEYTDVSNHQFCRLHNHSNQGLSRDVSNHQTNRLNNHSSQELTNFEVISRLLDAAVAQPDYLAVCLDPLTSLTVATT